MLSLAVILIVSYLLGSIPFSVWIGRALKGVDIRNYGSGNAGATNAFRVMGWKAGLMASIGDMGKGVLVAGVVATLRLDAVPEAIAVGSSWEVATVVQLMAGLAAVVGHMFPVWAHFQGGKGVNTSAGVLLALTPITLLITLGVFAVVLLFFRYVSLASIIAAISFPTLVAVRRYLFNVESLDPSLLVVGGLLALGILLAHRANIHRLLNGTEDQIHTFRPASGSMNN